MPFTGALFPIFQGSQQVGSRVVTNVVLATAGSAALKIVVTESDWPYPMRWLTENLPCYAALPARPNLCHAWKSTTTPRDQPYLFGSAWYLVWPSGGF